MIVRDTVQMPCPHCQHVQDFEVLLLVTGDMEPPLRDRIISGDWATFSCQKCQKQERILYPTLYEDRVRKVRIHYQPDETEAAQLLKQLPETVASYGPDYVDYQVRLVTNPLDFMEKVAIFTAGYDDRIMEAVKQALKQADSLPNDLVDLYFGLNPEGDKLFYLYTPSGLLGLDFDEALYQQIAERAPEFGQDQVFVVNQEWLAQESWV